MSNEYKCACGWVELDEWYAPYPLHDDSCPIQIELVEIECPNHEGAYDCTPFCRVCEGNQGYVPEIKMEVTQ